MTGKGFQVSKIIPINSVIPRYRRKIGIKVLHLKIISQANTASIKWYLPKLPECVIIVWTAPSGYVSKGMPAIIPLPPSGAK